MTAILRPHCFSGIVKVPASKSHTIRRLLIASMTNGVTEILRPLDCLDTRSCIAVCRSLGAEITEKEDLWIVKGIDSRPGINSPVRGIKRCCVGNSGTTLFLSLAMAALGSEPVTFEGDEQVRGRSAEPLLEALRLMGASVKSASGGCVPITICGPWKGGRVSLSCPTSQYLSAILLAASFSPAETETEIDVPLLNERPYIKMTLSYLDKMEIPYKAAPDFSWFSVPGGNAIKPLMGPVPGDFSSASFPAAAAAISGGSVTLLGLDPEDTQGDNAFFSFLERMGCDVRWERTGEKNREKKDDTWQLTVSRSGALLGGEFDLNDTPDLLPPMAAVACFARGDTALINAAHARLKETDRVAVTAEEFRKLGVKITERPDGIIVHGGEPRQMNVRTDGHGDHRIVMALACAALGLAAGSTTAISGAEAADISYPGFMELAGEAKAQ